MASRPFLLAAAVLSTHVLGESHYMFSGFFSGDTIVALEFEDTTSSLSIVQNVTTDASGGSKWIALDVRHPFYDMV